MTTRKEYALSRANLLAEIKRSLQADERFAAAWLTGSYARGDQDDFSDLDLTVVVAASSAADLCTPTSQADTARQLLFAQFGEIANLHNAHRNAPVGGAMVSVLYQNGITVDWILLPEATAVKPVERKELFDKIGIEESDRQLPLNQIDSEQTQVERFRFFWLMAAVTAKAILRKDESKTKEFLQFLGSIFSDVTDRPAPVRADPASSLDQMCVSVAQASPSSLPDSLEVIRSLIKLG